MAMSFPSNVVPGATVSNGASSDPPRHAVRSVPWRVSILSDAVALSAAAVAAEQAGSFDRSLYQRLLDQVEVRSSQGVPDRGSACGLWAGPPGEIYA